MNSSSNSSSSRQSSLLNRIVSKRVNQVSIIVRYNKNGSNNSASPSTSSSSSSLIDIFLRELKVRGKIVLSRNQIINNSNDDVSSFSSTFTSILPKQIDNLLRLNYSIASSDKFSAMKRRQSHNKIMTINKSIDQCMKYLQQQQQQQQQRHLSTTDDPRWDCVHIRALRPFKRPVSLEMCKAHPKLQDMALVKSARLSVQPVTPEEWQIICDLGGVAAE